MKYTLEIRMTGEQIVGIIEDENGNQHEVNEFYQHSWDEQLQIMDLKAMGRFFQAFVVRITNHLPERSEITKIQLHDNIDGWAFLDANGQTLQAGNYRAELQPQFKGYLKAMRLNGIAGQLERKAGAEFSLNTPLLAALWFKNEHADQYEQLAYFASFQEYLHYLFTGKNQIMPHLAARTGLYDLGHAQWDSQALALVGLTEGMLPDVVNVDGFEDQILPEFSRLLGLNKDTKIKW
ncbi:gluconate kinase [Weissella coleopterorum]|uniref:Gluconate kinase n=1 Tax=Weissella coleopterorum TaxID=2714949 RepID=A0A6G8AZ82_9LACO|nr:FGGY family carbohydrate kinase [Weissella coleopterorum]QIL50297.1 gluconate kinase [Weissella coleopterorum]